MNYNDVKLIELVKLCPTVYDSKIAEFKIPHRKEEAWMLISKEMEITSNIPFDTKILSHSVYVEFSITVLECRNRWRTIRERYARELRRHDTNSSWPYFHLMEFLTPFIKPREIRIKLAGSTIKNEYDDKSKPYHESLIHSDTSAASNKLTPEECAGNRTKFISAKV